MFSEKGDLQGNGTLTRITRDPFEEVSKHSLPP